MFSARSLCLSFLLVTISGASMAQMGRSSVIAAGSSCQPSPLACDPGGKVNSCTVIRPINAAIYQACMSGVDPLTALNNALATVYGVYPQCVSSDDQGVSTTNPGAPYAQSTTSPADDSTGTSATEGAYQVKASALVCLNPAYAYNTSAPAMIFVCTATGGTGTVNTVLPTPGPSTGVTYNPPSVNVHVDCGPQYNPGKLPGQDQRFPTPGYAAGNTHAVVYGLMASRSKFNVNYSGITQGNSVVNGFQMNLSNPQPYPGVTFGVVRGPQSQKAAR